MFERIFAGVAGSLITVSILALWHLSRLYLKKRRRIETDVIIVDQTISQDETGRFNVTFVVRNDAESTAVITGAKLVCTYKRKLELPIQAISKITPSANYDFEINPDDGNESYSTEVRQQIPAKNIDSFTVRIDSSTNNWVSALKIILLVNENAKELHSKSIGVYFEDVFDGWGLDHGSAHEVQRKINECDTKTKTVGTLLNRMKDRTNQDVPGWVIYIPAVTLSAIEAQGADRTQLINGFLLQQSEPAIFVSVEGLDEPVEIAKCGFVKPNLVETVGHVVHNRRTGKQFEPSQLFVMPRTGDDAGTLIPAETYWLVPRPEENQPVEGFAYIKLAAGAKNVRITERACEILDYESLGQQFS